MRFSAKALWLLVAFVLLLSVLLDQTMVGVGVTIAAAVLVELLTTAGSLGFGKGGSR